MLQIAICDDDIEDLSNMVQLLEKYRTLRQLNCEYSVFHNGFDLVSALERRKRFDIYCLDIILPAFSGLDLAKEIRTRDREVPILFFTSSPEFALESYSVRAVNYILKPVSAEKLYITLDQVLEKMDRPREDTLLIKSEEGLERVLLSSLLYMQVSGRVLSYHLSSQRVVTSIDNFTSASERLLRHPNFLKSHRSYVVNMDYIQRLEGNTLLLSNHASVPIAQGKGKEVREAYLRYQMEE